MTKVHLENRIARDKNALVVLQGNVDENSELRYLVEYFCGKVVMDFSEIQSFQVLRKIYACGDLSTLKDIDFPVLIIRELSYGYENIHSENVQLVELGEVPVIVSKAGVYYRRLFQEDNCFDHIKSEHLFQQLTESNKESMALRTGIYLTEISKEISDDGNESLHYRLLRCSSNFTGPTDNFRDTDHRIVRLLNDCVRNVFESETSLNHVLVQIYENKKKSEENAKEVKSKIKAHSDKTKDMPKEGIIAFCTFYDKSNVEQLKPSDKDKYDLCYKQTSALTKLHFKLKSTVLDDSLEKEFSVTLYPNSAFLIPLSTNRLYTHEIRPSVLNVDQIPIRMGYVVRCSNLDAVHTKDQTYIKENGELIKLEEMTPEAIEQLRSSYYEENKSEKMVEYGKIHFSMNSGDYKKPMY